MSPVTEGWLPLLLYNSWKQRVLIILLPALMESLILSGRSSWRPFLKASSLPMSFFLLHGWRGIGANSEFPAQFIYDNLAIALNIIHSARKFGTVKLIDLSSSCVYQKLAPQPLKEEYLLSGPLEPTNEAYAVAKIAAIKMCRHYNNQYGAIANSSLSTESAVSPG